MLCSGGTSGTGATIPSLYICSLAAPRDAAAARHGGGGTPWSSYCAGGHVTCYSGGGRHRTVAGKTMPRKDAHHQTVVAALIADGWTITNDPLRVAYGFLDVYVDLAAELPIGAERGTQQIAVEVKSFVGASDVHDLETALGQYNLYRDLLSEVEPDRPLYLAVPQRTHAGILSTPLGQLIVRRQRLLLIVFDEGSARIVQWIP